MSPASWRAAASAKQCIGTGSIGTHLAGKRPAALLLRCRPCALLRALLCYHWPGLAGLVPPLAPYPFAASARPSPAAAAPCAAAAAVAAPAAPC